VSETAAEMPWLAGYPEGIDWAAPISEEPLPQAFDRSVEQHGAAPCIDFLGKAYSYREVGGLVDRAAKGLQSLGVGPGVRVGLLLPNTPYFVICYYAILKAGGTVVNFNPLYVEEEIEHQIEDSGTKIMVTLDLELTLPKVSNALAKTGLECVVVCSMTEILPFPKNLLFALFKRGQLAKIPREAGHLSFAGLVSNDGAYRRIEIEPREDIAVIQYTGGTTGVPKGAMLTHANVAVNARQVEMWFPGIIEEQQRIYGVLPLFHVFAMTSVMNLAVLIGAELVLVPRFDLKQTLELLDRKKVTLFPGVPTIYNAISHHPALDRYDLTSLRFCISGGAPLPVEVKRRFEELTGCTLVEAYGLSETSPGVTSNPLFGVSKEGSIGLPFPGTIIEIHDLDQPGRLLPVGENGEICVRGPQVMAGYWNRPEATAKTIVDGALHTGDIGYMDEDGYTFLIDRLKDLIICSGFNVYPRVIEEAIYRHESVAEVTVCGVPDDYRGEAPKAFVRLKEGHELSADALLAFLEDKLSKIEMPEYVEFRDELPKTMIGKLSKKELVAQEAAKRATGGAPDERAAAPLESETNEPN
jgi:long-chain acyl-CoA synthetase